MTGFMLPARPLKNIEKQVKKNILYGWRSFIGIFVENMYKLYLKFYIQNL